MQTITYEVMICENGNLLQGNLANKTKIFTEIHEQKFIFNFMYVNILQYNAFFDIF